MTAEHVPWTAAPPFRRRSWVSIEARQCWEPRLGVARAAFQAMEIASVRRLRPAALLIVSDEQAFSVLRRVSDLGLNYALAGEFLARGRRAYEVAIGRGRRHRDLLRALGAARPERGVGRLLGYPACCTTFYAETERRSPGADKTWSVLHRSHLVSAERSAEVPSEGHLNVLPRGSGIAATFHLPCATDCAESRSLASDLVELARVLGIAAEARLNAEMLAWPMAWSTLHGIGELTTPVFKDVFSTTRNSSLLRAVARGSAYPEKAPVGPVFPYSFSSTRRAPPPEPAPASRRAHHATVR